MTSGLVRSVTDYVQALAGLVSITLVASAGVAIARSLRGVCAIPPDHSVVLRQQLDAPADAEN